MSNLEIINQFLGAIFSGEMDKALELVDDNAVFISARPEANPNNPLHGKFVGKDGAQSFFNGFGELLEPGRFDTDHQHEKGDHVLMYGTLEHTARTTGKKFKSDWCLVCKIDNGKVALYHFYEDSEALYFALQH